jgi:ribosomal protein S12 methylthiotransferase accessory factor
MFLDSSSTSFHLRSRKKHSTNGCELVTRIKSSEETLAELLQFCKKNIVTRISEITHLDKLRIPNYSAVLPGTEDSIWVYSGKGITNADAKASAIMEAVERYSSLNSPSKKIIRGSYTDLSGSYGKVLHPDEVVEFVNPEFDDKNSITDFVVGFDLLNNENVLVPAQIALSRFTPTAPAIQIFPYFHTNGLASGNVLEEAIYHALCEVIERDASSIADLCASSIPYSILEQIRESLSKPESGGYQINHIPAAEKFVDDANIFPLVDFSETFKDSDIIRRLMKRFTEAGVNLLIKDITQKDIGVPTFVASSIEWVTHNYGYFAKGYGTDINSKIALIRAITEVSQTRVVNIQGARDDLKKIQYKENDEIYKRKWAFMDMPFRSKDQKENRGKKKNVIKFHEIKTQNNNDILDDIKSILNRLKKTGHNRAIIVELTDPKVRIPVVRAIVPGLETFEVSESIMGVRAKKYFKNLHLK